MAGTGKVGGTARRPAGKADETAAEAAESRDSKAFKQLADAWRALYRGEYVKAVKAAEPLLDADESHQWMALEAAHLQARAYWAEGSRRGRSRAKKLWGKLDKHSTIPAVKRRLEIAAALQSAADGDPAKLDDAIATLTEVLRQNAADSSTVEAAIVLGHLQTQARQFDEAEKTFQTAEPWVKKSLLLERLEFLDQFRTHPAILLTPAVVGLLRDLDGPADLPDRLALAQLHIRLPQLPDNLIRRASLHRENLPCP